MRYGKYRLFSEVQAFDMDYDNASTSKTDRQKEREEWSSKDDGNAPWASSSSDSEIDQIKVKCRPIGMLFSSIAKTVIIP